MTYRRRAVAPLAALVLALGLVGACSGGGSAEDGTRGSSVPVTLPDELVPGATPEASTTSTTSHFAASTTTAPAGPGQVGFVPAPEGGPQFTIEAPFSCRTDTVGVIARWSATNVATANLLVDDTQVPGTIAPEGPHELELPCDGRAHTVVLVLSGDDGSSVLASRAVLVADER